MPKTIKSPVEDYTGTSQFSEVTLDFKDGVAVTERISKPLENFLKRRGYTVSGGNSAAPKSEPDKGKGDEGKDDKGGGDVL